MCVEPPEGPTQTANHACVSMRAPRVVALLEDVTDPEATNLNGEGTSKEDMAASPTT